MELSASGASGAAIVNKDITFPAAVPFSYNDPATNGHGVMVSIFPQAPGDTINTPLIEVEF